MNFGKALKHLKKGRRVARKGWNGKGMYIKLQRSDKFSKMTLSYLYMKTADNEIVPFLASQTDILSSDWEIV